MERKKYQTPVIIVIPIPCGSIMQFPLGSREAPEGSVMSLRKEYNLEDCEDDEWLPDAGKVRKRVWEDE